MTTTVDTAKNLEPDALLQAIADYVLTYDVTQSQEAMHTARLCFMDTLGCGMLALGYPACTKMLGPIVPDVQVLSGARVPGTSYILDPVRAAFNVGCMIRWLDYNDTWLAAEWGHPSDNLGGILALTDYLSRRAVQAGSPPLKLRVVLEAMIKAHEIQGILALENAFNRRGLDHVLLVRIATTAVAAGLLGCDRDEVINAVSNAFIDGGALRTYRHTPNTGSRKSWAAGDATSRGVWLALMAQRGEMGYPTALSAKIWGFEDALFDEPLKLPQPFGSYVMENVLFKISYPAEFHAQTSVEAALQLHPKVRNRIDEISEVVIDTQEAAVRIIDKTGPLTNPADRDHCLQYMVAIGLIFGQLTADDYEDARAADRRIDALRAKMKVNELKSFSSDYLDQDKRSIGNAVQVFFSDGTQTERVVVEYPVGHRRRRAEGIPLLQEKFEHNLATRLPAKSCRLITDLCAEQDRFEDSAVHEFVDLMVI